MGLATGNQKTSKTVRKAGGLQRFRHSGCRHRREPKMVAELRRNMMWMSLMCGAGLVEAAKARHGAVGHKNRATPLLKRCPAGSPGPVTLIVERVPQVNPDL